MASDFVTDVSLLEGGAIDTGDFGPYEDAQLRKPTPPAGKYYLRLPDQFGYKKNKAGTGLVISMDPLTVVGGEHDGYQIKFHSVNTTKFKNSVGYASSAGDVLRNFGIDPSGFKTVNDWAEAFSQLAGQTTPSPVYCDWRAYDKENDKEYRGMKRGGFAMGEHGFEPYVEVPQAGTAETRRVWAYLEPTVRGFSPVA